MFLGKQWLTEERSFRREMSSIFIPCLRAHPTSHPAYWHNLIKQTQTCPYFESCTDHEHNGYNIPRLQGPTTKPEVGVAAGSLHPIGILPCITFTHRFSALKTADFKTHSNLVCHRPSSAYSGALVNKFLKTEWFITMFLPVYITF